MSNDTIAIATDVTGGIDRRRVIALAKEVSRESQIDEFVARGVTSFDEASALLGDIVESIDTYDDGFTLIDKRELVNRPFLIMAWGFSESEKFVDADGEPAIYAVVRGITQDGLKFVFSDGGAGIVPRLAGIVAERVARGVPRSKAAQGLYVAGGLSGYANSEGGVTYRFAGGRE